LIDQKLTEQDQPIPIEKKCSRCGEIKLLSEFDIAHKSTDDRAAICKTCERNRREEDSEFCCDGPGHTNTCLINKTLVTIYYELDVFLARIQNGLFIPPDIIELMYEIIKQNAINESRRAAAS